MGSSTKYHLICILLAALIIRLICAYVQPFQVDEGFTWQVTHNKLSVIYSTISHDSHPPLHNFVMRPLVRCTSSPFWLRLPELLVSLSVVYFCFLLGERAHSGWGIPSALLYACSYMVWMNNSQFRSYGFLDGGIWATIYLLVRIIDTDKGQGDIRRKDMFCLLFSAFVAASLHYIGTLAVLCLIFLLMVLPCCKQLKHRAYLLACLGLAVIPVMIWMAFALSQSNAMTTQSVNETNLSDLFFSISSSCGLAHVHLMVRDVCAFLGLSSGVLARLPDIILWLLSAALWLAVLRGAKILWHTDRPLAYMLFFPYVLLCACLIISTLRHVMPIMNRHLLPLAPVLFICLAAGMSAEQERSNLCRYFCKSIFGVIVLFNLLNAAVFPFYQPLWRLSCQPAFDFIKTHSRGPGVILSYVPMSAFATMLNYGQGSITFDFAHQKIEYAEGYSGLEVMPLHPAFIGENCELLAGKQVFLMLMSYDPNTDAYLNSVSERYGVADSLFVPNYWGSYTVYRLVAR